MQNPENRRQMQLLTHSHHKPPVIQIRQKLFHVPSVRLKPNMNMKQADAR